MILSLACRRGLGWGPVSRCPVKSKNRTGDRWGLYWHTSLTNFAEIRFLREPESTSTLAADAPLSGSKSQTDMVRAAGAHPIQRRQRLEPLPNATVVAAQRDNSENGGNHSSTQRLPNQPSPLQRPLQWANPAPTCIASPRAPLNTVS